MTRPLRFVPAGALVEVTCRTLHGRFLLRPGPEVRDIMVGILGRAQRLYPVEVHAVVYLSNHCHLLITPGSAQRLALFMNYVNGNIARKVGRRVGWRQRFWSRRYQAIVVSEEEQAQVARLRYLLSHGAKEKLVYSPLDWPGVHSGPAMRDGSMKLAGTWFDETRAYAARQRGDDFDPDLYSVNEVLELTALPCWRHLPTDRYRRRIEEMIDGIEREILALHREENTAPAGITAVLQLDPLTSPRKPKRSPAPAFHAATRATFLELREAYRVFVGAFYAAAERMRRGDPIAAFPPGSFPPRQPFVDPAPG